MEILGDYVTSVKRAFEEIDPNYNDYDALVICGSHNPQNTEELIDKIKEARETGRPFYGECFGHQLCAIEYARNKLGIVDATSEEWGQGTFVVKKIPEGLNVGLKGGQSYWNNYKVIEEVSDKWARPKNFFTAQYHASYQSSLGNFHPLIEEFINYSKKYDTGNRN